MSNKTKSENVTGSMTLAKLFRKFFPQGGKDMQVTIKADGQYIAPTTKRATNNLLSLETLAYALLKSGVVKESNLSAVLMLAAETKVMDKVLADVVAIEIERVKLAVENTLPNVEVDAALRLSDISVAALVVASGEDE